MSMFKAADDADDEEPSYVPKTKANVGGGDEEDEEDESEGSFGSGSDDDDDDDDDGTCARMRVHALRICVSASLCGCRTSAFL